MTQRSALLQHLRRAADARLLLLLLGCLAIVVALGRPQIFTERQVFRYVFVFDITASMNVDDVSVEGERATRLALAKQAVEHAMTELPCSSEVGLALFTHRRALLLFTPVEVCSHHSDIATMLDAVDGRLAWRTRSEIARGMNSSLQSTAALERPARLVFLSDGHEAPPIHPDFPIPINPAGDEIRGLVVGVGGDKPMPIPLHDRDGTFLGFWSSDDVQQVDSASLGRNTDAAEPLVGVDVGDLERRIALGTEHLSSLREPYLQQLAADAGLNYFRLDTVSGLAQRLLQHDLAEPRIVVAELHWLGALVAALCVLGAVVGRRSWPQWHLLK